MQKRQSIADRKSHKQYIAGFNDGAAFVFDASDFHTFTTNPAKVCGMYIDAGGVDSGDMFYATAERINDPEYYNKLFNTDALLEKRVLPQREINNEVERVELRSFLAREREMWRERWREVGVGHHN